MFQLLKNPNFDFMARRNVVLGASMAVVLICIGVLVVKGVPAGIEFTGGTEVKIKFAAPPDIAAIRSVLDAANLSSQSVTRIGVPSDNEIAIRLPLADDGSDTDTDEAHSGAARRVRQTIRNGLFGAASSSTDINTDDSATLARFLEGAPGLTPEQATAIATAILDKRADVAIFESIDDLADVPGMTADAMGHLRSSATAGPLAARGQSYIGPAIGRELMNKAMLAIVGSMIGMLIYIWIRFQLQWGFAAVVALIHDSVITLGLFSLFGKEMSLAVVAAFLTLIGYSVNDTVVVFDRIRENLKQRRSEGMVEVINRSINQTLSRTIITSGLTWIVVLGLLVFGGSALEPFSFVLTVGVVVGTYSSIYVASPFLLLWTRFLERRKRRTRAAAPAA